jgi:hypothetical protein
MSDEDSKKFIEELEELEPDDGVLAYTPLMVEVERCNNNPEKMKEVISVYLPLALLCGLRNDRCLKDIKDVGEKYPYLIPEIITSAQKLRKDKTFSSWTLFESAEYKTFIDSLKYRTKYLNDALFEIYSKFWPGLLNVFREFDLDSNKIHYPVLINVPPEYENVPIKLFIVGQQTRGSKRKSILDINELLSCYQRFNLGHRFRQRPFWQACHELYKTLNPIAPKYGFIWSNLIKIDENSKRPSPELEERICSAFPVLPLEIEITRPNVVVFFTGPNYDIRLKKTFEGLKLEPIDGYNIRAFARLIHNSLPQNSFRAYHPVYIKRGKPYKLEDIFNEIKRNITIK